MDFVEKVRKESHAKGQPQRDYQKHFIQDSLPPPSFSVLGKLISVLEKSGDHEPQRRP